MAYIPCLLYTSPAQPTRTSAAEFAAPAAPLTHRQTPGETAPVSYTHLDVYKRQPQNKVLCGGPPAANILDNKPVANIPPFGM